MNCALLATLLKAVHRYYSISTNRDCLHDVDPLCLEFRAGPSLDAGSGSEASRGRKRAPPPHLRRLRGVGHGALLRPHTAQRGPGPAPLLPCGQLRRPRRRPRCGPPARGARDGPGCCCPPCRFLKAIWMARMTGVVRRRQVRNPTCSGA